MEYKGFVPVETGKPVSVDSMMAVKRFHNAFLLDF